MTPPKKNDLPLYMYLDADRGGYAVRNPITGKKKRFSDEGKARKMAGLMAEWVAAERQAQAFDAGKPKIAGTVDAWIRDRMPFMPWDEGTRYAITCKLKRIRRELGDRILSRTDRLFLDDWLTSFCRTADQWNKWRYVLVLLWDYAIAKKLAEVNEAEKLLERSTSKKLAMNQKVRQKLDEEGFQAIHGKAPTWLQIAMEQSLVTLQARTEVCNMRHVDYRGGYLFVIRDKVSGDSDMAFIKIAITPELEDIRRRSMLDAVLSPYLVHRSPSRQRREWTEGKPHWTYVNPEYLSKAFAEARDETKRFEHLKAPERPTFHEIRGLGARTYRARGIPESEVQALMTHANPRTTQIYLERGAAALTDDDYIAVKAPLSVREMLRAKGKT